MKRPVRGTSIDWDSPTKRVSRCVPPIPGHHAEVDLGLADLAVSRR